MKSLNLGHNSFAGTIPVSLGKLGDLEYLSLQSNSISGFLPSSLANMRSLTTVNIASNEISGVLPDISELDWLRSLVLAQNKLDGSIPESYTLLRSLGKFENLSHWDCAHQLLLRCFVFEFKQAYRHYS